MNGHFVTLSRGFFGNRSKSESIEGRADLLFKRLPGAIQLYPVIHLEGVKGTAQRFFLEIPIQKKLGQLYVGSESGQSFVLKQMAGYGL